MRWIIGLVVSALAVMTVGLVENFSPSVEAQVAEQAQAVQSQELGDAAAETLTVYSGGALEGVRKVTQDAASTTTSTAFVNLAGATTRWSVLPGDSDLLNVGFTAECRLINGAVSSTNQDWVELRVMLSRLPGLIGFPRFMEPYDTGSVMAFCSANGWAMHHANFAARVTGGTSGATYIVQVQYKVTNNAPVANPLGALSAWLDDWKLELLAFN